MNLPTQEQMVGKRIQGSYIREHYPKFLNQTMSKTWVELFQLESFFSRYHFNNLIEVGSGTGTCSVFLALHAWYKKAKFYTFDIKPMEDANRDLIELLGGLYYVQDNFSQEGIERIIARIQRTGTTILYLDGGDKRREADIFCPQMKKGDLCLVHDWGEEFKKEDADKIGKQYNLDYVDYEWFNSFVGMHIGLIKK